MSVIVKELLGGGSKLEHRLIEDYSELKKVVENLRKMGYKVVLTQGVYDLIHEGHAAYLEAAKELGDILIVGVDSDALTRKRKGPDRPIVPQLERLKMLVHLRHVDIVTLKNEGDDIGDLIRVVKPDIFVVSKSTKDFTDEMVKEYKDYCGKIVSLPPQAPTTTSARIRNLAIEGTEKLVLEIKKLTDSFVQNLRNKN